MIVVTDAITGNKLEVQVVTEDDLSSACMWFDSFTDEETYQRYEVYRDCVDHCFYAVMTD